MNKAVKYTYITIGINLLIAFLIFLWLLAGTKNPIKDLVDFILDFLLDINIWIYSDFYSRWNIRRTNKKNVLQHRI